MGPVGPGGLAGHIHLHRKIVVVIAVAAFFCAIVPPSFAQIGGRTAADGPFMLDNVEDRDTTASGVMRAWVPDSVPGETQAFRGVDPTTGGLTLALGQTPNGAFRYRMKSDFGYIDYSFGVPMPAVAGASTLTNPGNITSFTSLTFLARFSLVLTGQKFQVILECYPGPPYPKIYWNYTPTSSTTYQKVTINLRNPTLVQNAGSLTVEDLLSQTRFLAFYAFAGEVFVPATQDFFIDDIKLEGVASSGVGDWVFYY
ncbi:MAG: hypothetical protein V2A74_07470 [bacterium]